MYLVLYWRRCNYCRNTSFFIFIHALNVVWINGPFPRFVSGIMVFRGGDANEDEKGTDQSALYFHFEEGDKAVADCGYAGDPRNMIMMKDKHSTKFKEILAHAENRQETFHWWFKAFSILRRLVSTK